MRKPNIHVVPHQKGWAIRREHSERVTAVVSTQREAEERARDMARRDQVELLIHGRNGKIRERDSYGNDPFPPKG